MTAIDLETGSFSVSRLDWLDSVAPEVHQTRETVFTGLKSWVTGLVYGVEAPAESSYTRFENQRSQVAFANSIPTTSTDVDRGLPL